MDQLTWLIVGGCPRSGTTALGEALSKSPDISLLHEYDSKAFFEAVELFFRETERHQAHPHFQYYANVLPVRERDAANIAKAVFETVIGRTPKIIGTKFPGHQAWAPATYPPGVRPKEIITTRNPFDVVYSYAHKMIEDHQAATIQEAAQVAFGHWLHAWNYTISNYNNPDVLNVFYDDLDGSNITVSASIASFLDLANPPDLTSLKANRVSDIEAKFASAALSDVFAELSAIWSYDNWLDRSKADFASGRSMILPLPKGGIDLSKPGSSSVYLDSGFYPVERDGAWTKGKSSTIRFSVTPEGLGDYFLVLHVIWAAMIGDKAPKVQISIDCKPVAEVNFHLGNNNGKGQDFHILVRDFSPAGSVTTVTLLVKDPVNPKRLGISSDDRDLGLMIKKVDFRPVARAAPVVHRQAQLADGNLNIVCQGPILTNADHATEVFASVGAARKMGYRTVLSTWKGEELPQSARDNFDIIVASDDPGPSRFNAFRQSISTLAGLAQIAGPTLKTRTDIVLSERFLLALSDPIFARKPIVASNLFTRIHPFHLTDMVMFAHSDIIRDYFAIDNDTEDRHCEHRFSVNLTRRRYPQIAQFQETAEGSDAWRRFLAENVQLFDFKQAGLKWQKRVNIEEHPHWVFDPSAVPGTLGNGALMLGEEPFPTPINDTSPELTGNANTALENKRFIRGARGLLRRLKSRAF